MELPAGMRNDCYFMERMPTARNAGRAHTMDDVLRLLLTAALLAAVSCSTSSRSSATGALSVLNDTALPLLPAPPALPAPRPGPWQDTLRARRLQQTVVSSGLKLARIFFYYQETARKCCRGTWANSKPVKNSLRARPACQGSPL